MTAAFHSESNRHCRTRRSSKRSRETVMAAAREAGSGSLSSWLGIRFLGWRMRKRLRRVSPGRKTIRFRGRCITRRIDHRRPCRQGAVSLERR